jgi:ABC-type antimicrobial peptide transport system permease subunit
MSIVASRSISGLLFQVPATDMSAFILAGGTLALTAGVAIWFPARRASRADPIEILRT